MNDFRLTGCLEDDKDWVKKIYPGKKKKPGIVFVQGDKRAYAKLEALTRSVGLTCAKQWPGATFITDDVEDSDVARILSLNKDARPNCEHVTYVTSWKRDQSGRIVKDGQAQFEASLARNKRMLSDKDDIVDAIVILQDYGDGGAPTSMLKAMRDLGLDIPISTVRIGTKGEPYIAQYTGDATAPATKVK